MEYWSYVIYSKESGSFYYGYADDIEKLVEIHNSGRVPATRGQGPWFLMHSEKFDNKAKAIRQSRFYRTTKGQWHLKKILNF